MNPELYLRLLAVAEMVLREILASLGDGKPIMSQMGR